MLTDNPTSNSVMIPSYHFVLCEFDYTELCLHWLLGGRVITQQADDTQITLIKLRDFQK